MALPLLCLGALGWEEALSHTRLHIQALPLLNLLTSPSELPFFFCQLGTVILFSDIHPEGG